MTWPLEYQRAAADFERFIVAARDAAGLQTTNMAWTTVEGVLLTFRRRLTTRQILEFAGVLPPLLRALFLENLDPEQQPQPFSSRQAMTAEVQALRSLHNFSPSNAIEAVAVALRGSVDEAALDKVLASFPPEANAFWTVPTVQ